MASVVHSVGSGCRPSPSRTVHVTHWNGSFKALTSPVFSDLAKEAITSLQAHSGISFRKTLEIRLRIPLLKGLCTGKCMVVAQAIISNHGLRAEQHNYDLEWAVKWQLYEVLDVAYSWAILSSTKWSEKCYLLGIQDRIRAEFIQVTERVEFHSPYKASISLARLLDRDQVALIRLYNNQRSVGHTLLFINSSDIGYGFYDGASNKIIEFIHSIGLSPSFLNYVEQKYPWSMSPSSYWHLEVLKT